MKHFDYETARRESLSPSEMLEEVERRPKSEKIQTSEEIRQNTLKKVEETKKKILELEKKKDAIEKEIQNLKRKLENREKFLSQENSTPQ